MLKTKNGTTNNKQIITVLKPKNNRKRQNDSNDLKNSRVPKLNVGYYVLNLSSLQKNSLVNKSLEKKTSKDKIFTDYTVAGDEIHLEHIKESENYDASKNDIKKFGIFDSLTELNDISVDMCKEYFELARVELPNQQLTSVPNDVWKLNNRLKQTLEENRNENNDKLMDNNMYLKNSNLHPIRVLDLSCNYLKQISSEIKNLCFLQVLNLSNNQLTSLPNEVSELEELEEVHLSYNLFQNLPKVLYKLKNLRLLFIKCNYISNIDKEFKNLTQLQVLDISQNNLYLWPYPVLTSKTIIELNLDNNKISVLPDLVHNLKTLKHLRLRYNHIRRLPKLHRMTSLELAEFRNNSIQNFPDFYGSIHLREIWLDNNQIQKIDANSLIGTVVRVLSISCNKINEINGHVSLLDTLRYLDISNNDLKTIPHDFYKLNKINVIKLNGNNFHDPNIVKYNTFCTNDFIQYIADSESDKRYTIPEGPRYFFIEKCKGKDIKSDNIQDCLKMTTDNTGHLPNWMFRRAEHDEILRLDLCHNRHVQLPTHLCKMSLFLEELFASNNLLVRLPVSIGSFIKLRILDLSSNSLSTLPKELVNCKQLYCLNISFNKFEAIPDILYSMQNLRMLFASNNRITTIDFYLLNKFKKFDVSKNCIQNVIFSENF